MSLLIEYHTFGAKGVTYRSTYVLGKDIFSELRQWITMYVVSNAVMDCYILKGHKSRSNRFGGYFFADDKCRNLLSSHLAIY